LSLGYNKIEKVQPHSFDDLVELIYMELQHNELESLPEDIFAKNKKLEQISLDNNKLKVISANFFVNNLQLKTLDLQNKSISQIEKDFQQNLRYSLRVDLKGNLCINETIQVKFVSKWSKELSKFKDCNVNFAINVLESKSIKFSKFDDENAKQVTTNNMFRYEVSSKIVVLTIFVIVLTCLLFAFIFGILGFMLYCRHQYKGRCDLSIEM
jgi:Leucine-rich repeat (LRR) protein